MGESGRSKRSGRSTLELAFDAARADAGIPADEIDLVSNFQQMDSVDAHTLATPLGIRPACQYNLLGGGGSTELLIA